MCMSFSSVMCGGTPRSGGVPRTVPDFAAGQRLSVREQAKFDAADRAASIASLSRSRLHAWWCPVTAFAHTLVAFVVEDGGRAARQ